MSGADEVDENPANKEDFVHEYERLGSLSPAKTVLKLTAGPLASQIVLSFYTLIDMFWVGHTIGEKGIAVFGVVFALEFFADALAQWLMCGLSIRTAYLFGENRTSECAQIYVDFVRLAFIFGIVTPVVVLPLTRPVAIWFGADDVLANMAFQYMIPIMSCGFTSYLYMMGCGFLQAGGRSFMYGCTQVGSFVLNMGVFDPLFLVGLKTPIWGASLATALAEGIPGIVLTILVLSGKLGVKPKAHMFLKCPVIESWKALKMGIPSLMTCLSWNIPSTIMQKFVNLAATAVDAYETVVAVWAVVQKLTQISVSSAIAVSYGMLPASSFAYGAGRLNRVMWLFIHAMWMSCLGSSIIGLTFAFFPRYIAMLWGNGEKFLDWSEQMVPLSLYTSPTFSIQFVLPALLQATHRVIASTILSVITLLLPLPMFSSILYYTGKEDPVRILWTYWMNDTFSLLVCLLFLIEPMRVLWRAERDEQLMRDVGKGIELGYIGDLTCGTEGQPSIILDCVEPGEDRDAEEEPCVHVDIENGSTGD